MGNSHHTVFSIAHGAPEAAPAPGVSLIHHFSLLLGLLLLLGLR